MKNTVLFVVLIILVGLTTIEFQKKVLHKPLTANTNFFWSPREKNNDVPKASAEAKSFEGEYLCLPNKQRKMSQTTDCIYGLKLNDSTYVALKTGEFTDQEVLKIGNRLQVKGTFTPAEQITAASLKEYPITGIVKTTEIKKL